MVVQDEKHSGIRGGTNGSYILHSMDWNYKGFWLVPLIVVVVVCVVVAVCVVVVIVIEVSHACKGSHLLIY